MLTRQSYSYSFIHKVPSCHQHRPIIVEGRVDSSPSCSFQPRHIRTYMGLWSNLSSIWAHSINPGCRVVEVMQLFMVLPLMDMSSVSS